MAWTREQIVNLLETSDAAVERAMLRLYENQTSDEQSAEATRYRNDKGFSASCAWWGSYYATRIKRGIGLDRIATKREGPAQHLARARKIALKHVKQLLNTANAKETANA